jgi:UDP-N-acetylmuramate dehydrogenase
MQIQENFSLRTHNTFGIEASARFFSSFSNAEELKELIAEFPAPLILGGGSNILLMANVNSLVLKNEIRGIDVIVEDEEHAYVRAGAGENWHHLVMNCVARGFSGLENLALIPGLVGASPMQNIGAYGVEVSQVMHELTALDIEAKELRTFNAAECEFGYRESVFKNKYKGSFVIVDVTYRLDKKPVYHTAYGAIEAELARMNVSNLDIASIAQAVINIRQSKLPDPAEIGNAGSFFKNPSVPAVQFAVLQASHPAIVGYLNADGTVKLAAGWLIEQCGWKGYRKGDAGCHASQALVLVNYGHASGRDIYDLSEAIRNSVLEKFGVQLEREVNLVY